MRSELKFNHLMTRERSTARLMNVKIPAYVSDAIERVAKDLDASKTEVVIALLNQGLEAASQALNGWKPGPVTIPAPSKVCSVSGCKQQYVAKGYCASHYQAARRGKLPLVG